VEEAPEEVKLAADSFINIAGSIVYIPFVEDKSCAGFVFFIFGQA
jgi:hypothetical protein